MGALAKWVANSPLTVKQIAASLDVNRVTLHRYMSGALMPGPAVAMAIERMTGGTVTCSILAQEHGRQ